MGQDAFEPYLSGGVSSCAGTTITGQGALRTSFGHRSQEHPFEPRAAVTADHGEVSVPGVDLRHDVLSMFGALDTIVVTG